jgi:hypothetical protein
MEKPTGRHYQLNKAPAADHQTRSGGSSPQPGGLGGGSPVNIVCFFCFRFSLREPPRIRRGGLGGGSRQASAENGVQAALERPRMEKEHFRVVSLQELQERWPCLLEKHSAGQKPGDTDPAPPADAGTQASRPGPDQPIGTDQH